MENATSRRRMLYLLERSGARVRSLEADLAAARTRRDTLIRSIVRSETSTVAEVSRQAGVSRQHVYETIGPRRTVA